jgi:aspartate-semialdehyde dehydrogenase
MDELFARPRRLRRDQAVEEKKFTKQIAFNVIPHIDVFMEDGYTKEEWKMMVETKKILDPQDQAHRHLRARAGLRRPLGGRERRVREPDHADEARDILREAPGVMVIDKREDGGYVTPHRMRRARTPPTSRRIREDPRSRTASPVVRLRQPAQGRGAERGADRRAARMHRAWINTDGLPEYRVDEYRPVVDRWMKTVGKLPD